MGGQLDGNFLPGSLPHKFILTVTLIICFVVNIFFLSHHSSIVLLCCMPIDCGSVVYSNNGPAQSPYPPVVLLHIAALHHAALL